MITDIINDDAQSEESCRAILADWTLAQEKRALVVELADFFKQRRQASERNLAVRLAKMQSAAIIRR